MTEQKVPASFRNLLTAVDVITEESMTRVMNEMRGQHIKWHQEQQQAPSGECHTCALIGIAEAPKSPVAMPSLDDESAGNG